MPRLNSIVETANPLLFLFTLCFVLCSLCVGRVGEAGKHDFLIRRIGVRGLCTNLCQREILRVKKM